MNKTCYNKIAERSRPMAKIIAIANQKGGVGKTTTVVNLSSCIAERGKKVLLIDLDAQGNATSGCGISKRTLAYSAYNILIDNTPDLDKIIKKTLYKNLWIIPSTMDLAGAEIELSEQQDRTKKLKRAIADNNNFDYIFIDCPPSLGLITLNALTAANTVLIPIQCEFYALEGLSQLTNTIKQVKKQYNQYLDIEGVLVTMYDGRLNLTGQVLSEVKKFFADKTFKTVIPRNVRISEAPSHGKPINYYDKGAKGSMAYYSLADEILKNDKSRRL